MLVKHGKSSAAMSVASLPKSGDGSQVNTENKTRGPSVFSPKGNKKKMNEKKNLGLRKLQNVAEAH